METLFILLNVLTFALIYLVVNYKLKRRSFEKHASKIPGPPALPVVGNSLLFYHIKTGDEMWNTILHEIEGYDKILRLWLGPNLIVFLTDPDYIEAVMSNPLATEKDPCYKVFQPISLGIFTKNGEIWKRMRKPLNRMLQSKLVVNTQDIVVHQSQILADKVEKLAGTGTFDVHHLVALCTLDILCATHLGIDDVNEQTENKFDLPKHLSRCLNIMFQRIFKPQFYSDVIFNLTKAGKKLEKYAKDLNATSYAMLTERSEILSARGEEYNSSKSYECYTDVILSLGKEQGLTMEQLAPWLSDFLIAGSDTTAVVIASVILNLAMYPEYQKKVYAEQIKIFGDSFRPPTPDDIAEMKYLTMCYNESLRHNGPPAIMRTLGSDIDLDKYTLPAGASIYLVFYKLHNDPRLWEHPNKYYPDHFLPEQIAARPKGSFVPFSSGPRGCPGKQFADFSVKIILSTILRRFKFSTLLKPETLKNKYSLLLEVSPGFHVSAEKRGNIF